MSGIKLLFRVIWDEFKTLIFIASLTKQDVESQTNYYSTSGVYANMPRRGPLSSESPIAHYKKCQPYQKWYQTKDGRDLFMKRLGHVLAVAAVVIYFVQMQANRRQAEAAERQLNEAHKDFVVDQRAWVFPIGLKQELSDDREFDTFVATFKNTGKTPAFNAQGVMNWATNVGQMTSEIEIPGRDHSVYSFLAPNETEMIPSHPIPSQVASNISDTNMVFLYGKISYSDIFGSNHWTKFGWAVLKDGLKSQVLRVIPLSYYNTCDGVETNQSHK